MGLEILGLSHNTNPKGPGTQIVGLQGPNALKCVWALKPDFLSSWTLGEL